MRVIVCVCLLCESLMCLPPSIIHRNLIFLDLFFIFVQGVSNLVITFLLAVRSSDAFCTEFKRALILNDDLWYTWYCVCRFST